MLKERPAEGRVECVPLVGLSSVLSSFQTLSSSVLPEALLLLAAAAPSVATSATLFDAQLLCNVTLTAFTYTSDSVAPGGIRADARAFPETDTMANQTMLLQEVSFMDV